MNLTDPTGHMQAESDEVNENPNSNPPPKDVCEYVPALCKGGRWNPLNYDTFGIGAKINLKMVGGGEITPIVYFDIKYIRELDFMKGGGVGLFVSTDVSAGASAEGLLGISIVGADGKAIEQMGVSVDANGSGCVPVSGDCFGIGGSFDPVDGSVDGIEYTYGKGKGVDFSLGMSYTDMVVYYDTSAQVIAIRLPIPIYGIGPIPPVLVIPIK